MISVASKKLLLNSARFRTTTSLLGQPFHGDSGLLPQAPLSDLHWLEVRPIVCRLLRWRVVVFRSSNSSSMKQIHRVFAYRVKWITRVRRTFDLGETSLVSYSYTAALHCTSP